MIFLFLACQDSEPPATPEKPVVQQENTPSQKMPQQPQGKPQLKNGPSVGPAFPNIPGMSASEDLSSSWREELGVSWTIPQKKIECPDIDGDGLVDANASPCGEMWPVDKLDCDDSDPKIGLEQEIYIPASYFIMGSTSSHAGADEAPVEVVWMDGYCLDRDELANKDFAAWLEKENRKPKGSDIRNFKNGIADSTRGDYPAEGVTWQEAHDYCQAQGKSLPTEAQWEKAARGGCEISGKTNQCEKEDLRAYPWGNSTAPSCELANHQVSASGMPKLCVSDTQVSDALPKGAGPYGHRHLAGNVWEYVADAWHPKVYSKDRSNPAGPKSGDIHVLRGGGWNTFSTNMRVANRFHDLVMGSAAGFRCARSFTEQVFDDVEPLVLELVKGSIRASKNLEGRAIYVTAFDANDADKNGMLAPGRSPIAEIRLTPNNSRQQDFEIKLPRGGKYILSAALDAGTGGQKDEYVSASGSGGFGKAKQNPIAVNAAVDGILIEMQFAPTGGPRPANPPKFQPKNPPNHPPKNQTPKK